MYGNIILAISFGVLIAPLVISFFALVLKLDECSEDLYKRERELEETEKIKKRTLDSVYALLDRIEGQRLQEPKRPNMELSDYVNYLEYRRIEKEFYHSLLTNERFLSGLEKHLRDSGAGN